MGPKLVFSWLRVEGVAVQAFGVRLQGYAASEVQKIAGPCGLRLQRSTRGQETRRILDERFEKLNTGHLTWSSLKWLSLDVHHPYFDQTKRSVRQRSAELASRCWCPALLLCPWLKHGGLM